MIYTAEDFSNEVTPAPSSSELRGMAADDALHAKWSRHDEIILAALRIAANVMRPGVIGRSVADVLKRAEGASAAGIGWSVEETGRELDICIRKALTDG